MAVAAISAAPVLASAYLAATKGPPFITDDPEPVDFHHWEFYLASQYFHPNGSSNGTFPHFELNYGAAPNLQIHLIAPLAFSDVAGGENAYGYGDTELGAKFRFIQEGRRTPMVGIFPLVEVPTGNHASGLGNGRPQIYFPVWIQKSFGNFSTYGGGGYWINPGPGNKNYWFVGWQAQYQVTKPLAIGFELFHTTAQAVGQSNSNGFNVGAIYDLNEGHHLMASVGRAFDGSNSGTAYVAYQLTWGPHDAKESTQSMPIFPRR